jgi:hypothetical protein
MTAVGPPDWATNKFPTSSDIFYSLKMGGNIAEGGGGSQQRKKGGKRTCGGELFRGNRVKTRNAVEVLMLDRERTNARR